jgi:hypothetical protein
MLVAMAEGCDLCGAVAGYRARGEWVGFKLVGEGPEARKEALGPILNLCEYHARRIQHMNPNVEWLTKPPA